MFTHFEIFGRDIYTYGLLAGIGLVLAGLYAMICVKRRKRDENDMNRKASPLRQADDAILLDTTDKTFDEAVDTVKNLIKATEAKN